MDRPSVQHNCKLKGIVSPSASGLVCEACHQRITDPMELSPRGTGFTPTDKTKRIERYRLEA